MVYYQVTSLRKIMIPGSQVLLGRTTLLQKRSITSVQRNNRNNNGTIVLLSLCQRSSSTFSTMLSRRYHHPLLLRPTTPTNISLTRTSLNNYRWLSSSSTNPNNNNNNNNNNATKGKVEEEGFKTHQSNSEPLDDGSGNSTELAPLTPGQKFQVGTRLTMWVGIATFAAACAYWIIKELLPTKMSPNSVFDRAFTVLRDHPEVVQRFGEPLKAYGRDHGGHREGRRNFVENTQYQCKEDGSNRTRIRFNLEGRFGQAFVFAEVSSDMPSGEFVYLLVQDRRNGRVITIVDNRTALTVKRMAGESKEGNEALHNLLVGSSSSSGSRGGGL